MTSDEEFAACDHADQLFDFLLGSTMVPTPSRLGVLAGLAIAAAIVIVAVTGLS